MDIWMTKYWYAENVDDTEWPFNTNVQWKCVTMTLFGSVLNPTK